MPFKTVRARSAGPNQRSSGIGAPASRGLPRSRPWADAARPACGRGPRVRRARGAAAAGGLAGRGASEGGGGVQRLSRAVAFGRCRPRARRAVAEGSSVGGAPPSPSGLAGRGWSEGGGGAEGNLRLLPKST
jgi:hypothetical protein